MKIKKPKSPDHGLADWRKRTMHDATRFFKLKIAATGRRLGALLGLFYVTLQRNVEPGATWRWPSSRGCWHDYFFYLTVISQCLLPQ